MPGTELPSWPQFGSVWSNAEPVQYLLMIGILIGVMVAATCICWMKKHASAENLGLPGTIKVTDYEEPVPNGTSKYPATREETRLSALQRELPQIPAPARRDSSAPSEPTSELYAVVADPGVRPPPAAAAPLTGPAAPTNGRQPPNYESLQPPGAGDETDEQDAFYEQPAVARARAERQSSAPPEPEHSRNPSASSGEIAARLAVAGGVPASQELPYMTPPVNRGAADDAAAAAAPLGGATGAAAAAAPAQQHFSGDSVQSADSRGYTRITVREPAAELSLRGATVGERSPRPDSNPQPLLVDNYYATVDDGSEDEMYEAIPERRRRGVDPRPVSTLAAARAERRDDAVDGADASGTTPGDLCQVGASAATAGSRGGSIPPPPSVDSLRQALVHSRQASCSSVASSSTSPPADRRSARSPLPPLPPDLDQLYAKVQKPPRGGAAGGAAPPEPSLRGGGGGGASPPAAAGPAQLMMTGMGEHHQPAPVNYSDFEVVRDPIRRARPVVRRESSLDPNYESIEGGGGGRGGGASSRRATAPPDPVDDDDDDELFGYDRVRRVDSSMGGGGGAATTATESEDGAGYARVRRLSSSRAAATGDARDPSTPTAAPLRRREHHYERVRRRRDEDPLYEKISGSPAASEVYDEIRWSAAAGRRGPQSDAESFYESVRFGSESGGDADPNYELLTGGHGPAGSETDELYASIWDRPTPDSVRLAHHTGGDSAATSHTVEDPYASIRRSSASPPYESIMRPQPSDSDSDSDTIGYESVRAAPTAGGAGDTGTATTTASAKPASRRQTPPEAAAIAPVDLSQLYARVQKVHRHTVAVVEGASVSMVQPPPPPPVAPYHDPTADELVSVASRPDSSSASTSQYTSASEAGTPLLPKRPEPEVEAGSPRACRRPSTASVDSGSVTQSDRDEAASLVP